jgi:hypothetical protein
MALASSIPSFKFYLTPEVCSRRTCLLLGQGRYSRVGWVIPSIHKDLDPGQDVCFPSTTSAIVQRNRLETWGFGVKIERFRTGPRCRHDSQSRCDRCVARSDKTDRVLPAAGTKEHDTAAKTKHQLTNGR